MSQPALATALFGQIPPRPPPDLDRLIDATERCLARYGMRRTSMTDIAREMGFSRPTLYRQVASLDEALSLVVARQVYWIFDEFTALLSGGASAETFIDAVVRLVTFGLEHPVIARFLNDEPELIGEALTGGRLPRFADQGVDVLAAVVENAMATGGIRAGDPRLTTAAIIRLGIGLVLYPAGEDLERIVRLTLEPMLEPAAKNRKTRTRT